MISTRLMQNLCQVVSGQLLPRKTAPRLVSGLGLGLGLVLGLGAIVLEQCQVIFL